MFDIVISNKLRFYREKLGVTLSDISLGSGISRDTISLIERNLRTPYLFTAYTLYFELESIHRLYQFEWEFPTFEEMFPVHWQ